MTLVQKTIGYIFFTLQIFPFINSVNAQLIVDNTTLTPQQLIEDILIGSGVSVSNITFNGKNIAKGSFTTGATPTNLALTSGIILTSGDALIAIGPNDESSAGEDNNLNGDPDLTALSEFQSYDQCIIEFDFIPKADTIRFKYIFASEEYPEYSNLSVNDAFGFFISGPGINGPYSNNSKNIALVPGTNIGVSINTINNGSAGTGPCEYCEYYVTNNQNFLQYDAWTTVLTAESAVIPCEEYHMKLAIGDAGDGIYDSGVFLEASSFSSPAITIGVLSDSIMIEGCDNAVFIFTRGGILSTTFTLHFIVGGDAANGTDYSDLYGNPIIDSVVFQPGEDEIQIPVTALLDNISESEEKITILIPQVLSCIQDTLQATIYIKNVLPLDATVTSDDYEICSQAGEAANITADISGGYGTFSYTWSENMGSDSSIVATPLQTTTYYVTITDTCGNVSIIRPVTIEDLCPLEIPNVITPDDNGLNDYFYVKYLEQYPNSEIIIYNRWGKKVYENSNYQNNWDGGKNPAGVYYYILNQSNGKKYAGTITILKS